MSSSKSLVALLVIGCLASLPHLAAAQCTGGSPSWTSTADQASFESCLASSLGGDTINVLAGTMTVVGRIAGPSHSLRIVGAGVGVTTIRFDTSLSSSAWSMFAPAGGYTTVSGFTLDAQFNSSAGARVLEIVVGTVQGLNTYRIHDNAFINLCRRAIDIDAEGVVASGLVDNNTFDWPVAGRCTTGQGVTGNNCATGGDQPQHAVMSHPRTFGTAVQNVVEDNVFSTDSPTGQDSAQDNYGCGRMLFRFNTTTGMNVGHHGTEIRRGTQQWVFHDNTFNALAGQSPGRASQVRNGTGLYFRNSWAAEYGDFEILMFRTRNNVSRPKGNDWWGVCRPDNPLSAGPDPKDGRLGGSAPWSAQPFGWPCLDQIGWWFDQDGGEGGTFERWPTYVFLNTKARAPFPMGVETGGENHEYFFPDIDYFNGVETPASFGGTTGVGVGTRAEMDAITTCAEWVGFWVTDEDDWDLTSPGVPDGRLYRCDASSNWQIHWESLDYPHPLRQRRALPR